MKRRGVDTATFFARTVKNAASRLTIFATYIFTSTILLSLLVSPLSVILLRYHARLQIIQISVPHSTQIGIAPLSFSFLGGVCIESDRSD
jgi:hypothetical protein